ncbi:hypothetical protein C4J97_0390 [Pseudomonas orientalis]|nr:hypothetical protein C4J97_0390 [Pseudomonas orientalis]
MFSILEKQVSADCWHREALPESVGIDKKMEAWEMPLRAR